MAEPFADTVRDAPANLNLDNLFSVSRVEVVQQISSDELKAVIQQLAHSIATLSLGPSSSDLQHDISVLNEELTALREAHASSIQQLGTRQVGQHNHRA